ncbi:acid protease [Lentinus tigrinus ALCF2SS1-6]|uniref:Acid protease n=1 Tax=Lentinus tigrinus ALCF2SS1-6 TaxID=1328759 RepID=A0A5C2S7H9_9APHY|nr:acid protease [Lentinus tigrinus ALCF2SS1-6]
MFIKSSLITLALVFSTCNGKDKYNATTSTTSVHKSGKFSISYADGSSVSGPVYTDTVTVAGVTAKNQYFSPVTTLSSSFAGDARDGILGMAYPALSQFNQNPFFNSAKAQGAVKSGVFAFKLAKSGSELYLGGTNSKLYTGSIEYHAVVGSGFWQIGSGKVQVGAKTVVSNIRTIIDSGTTLIYGPPSQVATLYASIPGSKASGNGFYTFPCTSVPNNVAFSWGGKSWTISAANMNLGRESATRCVGAIVGQDLGLGTNVWLVGDSFMKNVYSVFSFDQNAVGFASLKLSPWNWNDRTVFINSRPWKPMFPMTWLSARGFTPYPLVAELWVSPETTASASLPYALRLPDRSDEQSLDNSLMQLKVAPAQDAVGRDVMLKIISKDSVEYRICQDLLRCDITSPGNFQGVLPPLAILDTPHQFSFIVTPRWGHAGKLRLFETVGDVIHYVRCLLKDLDHQNILVNCYSLYQSVYDLQAEMREHRRSPEIAYCLFDFDRALQFPLDTPLRSCRTPASGAMVALSPYHPLDVSFGESEYNPFAFDVACLGNMFKLHFSHATTEFPMLAPLFDKMTTHFISERFSAPEALEFLEYAVKTSTKATYWSTLSPSFHVSWGAYKMPPLSWTYYVLDHIVDYRVGWKLLTFLQRVVGIEHSYTNLHFIEFDHLKVAILRPSQDEPRSTRQSGQRVQAAGMQWVWHCSQAPPVREVAPRRVYRTTYNMSSSDVAEIIAEYESSFVSLCCSYATFVYICYDWLLTLDEEINLFWNRRVSAASILYFAIRYLVIIFWIMGYPTNNLRGVSCEAYMYTIMVTQLLIYVFPAAFSALRVYALTAKNKILAAIVFLFALGPVYANSAHFAWEKPMYLPEWGCVIDDNADHRMGVM